jgi:hypothetical protein
MRTVFDIGSCIACMIVAIVGMVLVGYLERTGE